MLVSLKEILAEGRRRGIAIGSFNAPTFECLIAVIEAAEELDVPVIIAHAQCHEEYAPLDVIGPVMIDVAKRSKVPVCVHLDHGEDFDYVKRAIALGFSSVMIDYSTKPYDENADGTREVVDYAHKYGVSVESELGALPQREGGEGDVAKDPTLLYTKPELVPDYIKRTGIDALAIAFGTAHGIYKKTPILNMDIITKVHALTDIPLVMHGGSGISHDDYRKVIRLGISKINYYSYMAYEGYAEAKRTAERKSEDFIHVMSLNVKNAMKEKAKTTLSVFSGK